MLLSKKPQGIQNFLSHRHLGVAGSQQGSVLLCRCSPSGLEPMGLGAGSCRRVALGVALLLVDTRSPECAQRRALARAMASPAGQAHGRAPHCTRRVPAPPRKGRCGNSARSAADSVLSASACSVRQTPAVCARACVRAYPCACSHARVHTLVFLHVCVCVLLHVHILVHTCLCMLHTHVLTHVCVCVRGERGAESGTAAGGGAAHCGRVGTSVGPCRPDEGA